MIQFPAVSTILSEAYKTFKRFPGVLVCAIAGAFALSYYIDVAGNEEYTWLIYFIFTCSIGAVLFLNTYLFLERNRFNVKGKAIYSILVIAALCAYYFLQPDELNRISIVRFMLFNLALHLLVSFVAFIKYDEPNGFWHFNQRIFIRLFIALLYSLVLFAGTSLALATIDYLFNINFDGDNYLRAFYFIFIIFNSWIFLHGIPDHIGELEQDLSYPKLLKLFSQFVLLPLVGVYIIILYSYIVKLFIGGKGPDTNVAYMVLALAIAGILAFLLVWPLGKQLQYGWLRIYRKVFYIILVPLIVLFFIAIWHRVRDFGITENRYFVLVLALWLFGIALYFIFQKTQNIKVIPASLCVVTFLASFGPWGAIKFSKVSQLTRFETILTNNDLLKNGKAIPAQKELTNKEASQLYSVTKYLVDVFGFKVMQPYFNINLDSLALAKDLSNYSRYNLVLEQLNIQRPIVEPMEGLEQYFNLNADSDAVINIKGFDNLTKFYLNLNSNEKAISEHSTTEYRIYYDDNGEDLVVEFSKDEIYSFPLKHFVGELINVHGINETNMTYEDMSVISATEGDLIMEIVIQNIGGQITGDSITNLDHIDAWLLVGKKE